MKEFKQSFSLNLYANRQALSRDCSASLFSALEIKMFQQCHLIHLFISLSGPFQSPGSVKAVQDNFRCKSMWKSSRSKC